MITNIDKLLENVLKNIIFMNKPLKDKYLGIFVYSIFWILFWLSINTMPFEIYLFGESFIKSINSLRLLIPLILSIFLIIFSLYKLSFAKVLFYFKEYNSTYLFLFLFSTQFVSIIFNDYRNFNLDNIYLVILSYGTIFLFLTVNSDREKKLKYFLKINIFFLCLVCLVILSPKVDDIISNKLNFYFIFAELDGNILKQVNPRITGLSRSFAILSLFMLAFYFNNKNQYYKLLILIIFLIFNFFIITMESRGTILCFFLSTIFIILFLNSSEINVKIILIVTLIISNLTFLKISSKEIINIKDNNANFRLFNTNSSGRVEIWKHIVKNNDYKKFLGLGSQGDRYFLKNYKNKDIFGNNSSNAFLYTLLSGGYLGLIFLLMIYFNLLRKIFYGIKQTYHDPYYTFSVSVILFFLIRSLFENSFGLFSIDYLLIFSSILYIDSFHSKKNN